MIENLIVCRNLIKDEILNSTLNEFEHTAKLIERAETLGLSGNIPRSYLIYVLAHEPNLVSETLEKTGGKIGESLLLAFQSDIGILFRENTSAPFEFLNNYKPTVPNKIESLTELENTLSNKQKIAQIAACFIEYYKKYGYGDIAAYRAFKWSSEQSKLVGIKYFEKILLEDLIGYAHQKELLTKNTIAFIEGKPANNVLLVGARGTGKSSGVKALVNEYYKLGLRLVQITQPQLKQLPEIMEALRKFASKRFIIFLDDLSFEENETEYKYLKSAIEGGVESRPEKCFDICNVESPPFDTRNVAG